MCQEKRGQNVHYGLEEDALTGTLVHFLAEVCPYSRPLRKDSAEAAKRKRGRTQDIMRASGGRRDRSCP